MKENPDKFLSEREAAELMGIQPRLLASWRARRVPGLPYTRMGRSPRYRLSDIQAFIRRRTVID